MQIRLIISLLLLAAAFAGQTAALGQNPDAEVEYLLTAIGNSNCTFIRNDTRHTSTEAEDHLRMKYDRTKRYIDSADEFIAKLASESSWTGKAYFIECPESGKQSSRQWLSARLTAYRKQN